MQKKIYFAYGANTNKDAMAIRCPKAKVIGGGHIYGYRLKFNNVLIQGMQLMHLVLYGRSQSLAKDPWIDSRVIRHCMTRLR